MASARKPVIERLTVGHGVHTIGVASTRSGMHRVRRMAEYGVDRRTRARVDAGL